MAHLQGNWKIKCSYKIVVDFVVTLVLLMPLVSLSHSHLVIKKAII